MNEQSVLSAARVAMILGDWELVSSVIPFRYKIKHYREENELLLQMKNKLRDRGLPLPADLAARFTDYFERMRAPESDCRAYEIARFELGVLSCKYIDTAEPFSWDRVVRTIAR